MKNRQFIAANDGVFLANMNTKRKKPYFPIDANKKNTPTLSSSMRIGRSNPDDNTLEQGTAEILAKKEAQRARRLKNKLGKENNHDVTTTKALSNVNEANQTKKHTPAYPYQDALNFSRVLTENCNFILSKMTFRHFRNTGNEIDLPESYISD